jgi:hypothetical protein
LALTSARSHKCGAIVSKKREEKKEKRGREREGGTVVSGSIETVKPSFYAQLFTSLVIAATLLSRFLVNLKRSRCEERTKERERKKEKKDFILAP